MQNMIIASPNGGYGAKTMQRPCAPAYLMKNFGHMNVGWPLAILQPAALAGVC
jgi:hypothetical protein